MFGKLLIANRGEIACRVVKTAARLGIRTVAVYSEADRDARHVALADEAVMIGPAAARESYLVADNILAAAARTGAEAVHPGYGFLAENADFAQACADAGLIFVGPSPAAIRAMGEKGAAKALMIEAGVPVVPGYHGQDQSDDRLATAAEETGYPVLIKAVAGGGGKGMRQVDTADKFAAALKSARRESKAAFGDDKVLVERYLARPRHIEVQVFADQAGNAVHLFERDCSVQRRHQKVLEEAPAPGMTAEMRRMMGEAAVAAARAIDYVGAGTVEFIADVSHGLSTDAFFFMEMNTRLQVEHPVTEMITGQDLVEWQLRVAAGEPLPLGQDALAIDGHAVEARIYAEDPARKFFPSTGTLRRLRMPADDVHLRVDTGVREGDEVSIHYDPMIAKLIAWDVDRTAALRRLKAGLEACEVAGVTTNIAFLAAVAGHHAFEAGDVETGFIDKHRDDLVPARGPAPDEVIAIACLDVLAARREAVAAEAAGAEDPHSPWAALTGWRLNDEGYDLLHLEDDERLLEIAVHYRADGGVRLSLPGGDMVAAGERDGAGALGVDLDGLRSTAAVVHQGEDMIILWRGHTYKLRRHDPLAVSDIDLEETGSVAAPLPGKVVQVMVAAGESVKKGAPLLVMEAMKMEHTISAPADGVVESVNFGEGDQVDEGAVLIAFESGDG